MADPQLENGYTAIADEILEALARTRLPGQETQLLWAILRKTWGWKKKMDRISLSQFARMTGLDRRRAHKCLNSLVSKNIVKRGVTQNGDSKSVTYGFNKNYETWRMSPKKTPVTKNGDKSVTQSGVHNRELERESTPDFISPEIPIREQIKSHFARYPNPDLIRSAFDAIASMRKSGKVADSVLLAQLKKWERYPVDQVEAGIRIYLDRDYAAQGKDEKYASSLFQVGNRKFSLPAMM